MTAKVDDRPLVEEREHRVLHCPDCDMPWWTGAPHACPGPGEYHAGPAPNAPYDPEGWRHRQLRLFSIPASLRPSPPARVDQSPPAEQPSRCPLTQEMFPGADGEESS